MVLAEQFGVSPADIPEYADETDNAPGSWRQVVSMESGERKWTSMHWGYAALIHGAKKFIFNAQGEMLLANRTWRAILGNRCIVPASAFFEWKKIEGKPGPKYEITVRDQPVFGFAALYEDKTNPKTGHAERVFWIITTRPNRMFANYHDRQPVILDPGEYEEWLTPSARPPLHLVRVFPEERMLITKVADAPDPKPKKQRSAPSKDAPRLFDF